MTYPTADHGQPDSAQEAYYNYLDACEMDGDRALSFEDWNASVTEYNPDPAEDAYMVAAETNFWDCQNAATDYFNRFGRGK